jgi:quinol monooxygenase YgiN
MYPLISIWTILPGNEEKVFAALEELAANVEKTQPGTLAYLVHAPDTTQPSLPTPCAQEVVFFEIYKDREAFDKHVASKAFTDFVKVYGPLFLSAPKFGPYRTVEFLTRKAGFIRPAAI